jgi:hypothetical protein
MSDFKRLPSREVAEMLGKSTPHIARAARKLGLGKLEPIIPGWKQNQYTFTRQEVERLRLSIGDGRPTPRWQAIINELIESGEVVIDVPLGDEKKYRNGIYQAAHRRGVNITLSLRDGVATVRQRDTRER